MWGKAWAWLKKWGLVLLALLLSLVGAAWVLNRQKSKLGQLRDELAVAEATQAIAALRARREEVAARVGEQDVEIQEIDGQLADNQRKIVEAYEGGAGLSAEEVAAELARLGY
jgi:uncharacterized protein HemX